MDSGSSKQGELSQEILDAYDKIQKVKSEIAKVIVGQNAVIDRMIMALLCNGHVLLEGVPGIAKTLIVNTLSKVLQLDFKRIQFTPDLLPSDLIGTSVYNPKEQQFFVQKGPVFTNVVLADEINRAPPKVQSALLEVMQEKQVTIGGETFKTGSPFFVLATQNPIEHEGTYPLPEAEVDRFMLKIKMTYPNQVEESEIIRRITNLDRQVKLTPILDKEDLLRISNTVNSIYLDDKISHYIVSIIFATRSPEKIKLDITGLLEYGASPRASIYLTQAAKAHALMDKRSYVTPYDVKEVAYDVLRHRLILSYEASAQEITPEMIIQRIFEKIPVP